MFLYCSQKFLHDIKYTTVSNDDSTTKTIDACTLYIMLYLSLRFYREPNDKLTIVSQLIATLWTYTEKNEQYMYSTEFMNI